MPQKDKIISLFFLDFITSSLREQSMLTQLLFRNVKYKTTHSSYTLLPLLPPCSPAEGITWVFANAVKQQKCLVHSGKLSCLKIKKYLFPNGCSPDM